MSYILYSIVLRRLLRVDVHLEARGARTSIRYHYYY